jgi:hypothetical protein
VKYIRAVVIALLTALFTWVVGWWAVPLVSFAAGLFWRAERGHAGATALGAALGWGVVLLLDAAHPRFGSLAATLGELVHAPGVVPMAVTLAFAALLAWSAATVATIGGRSTTPERTTADAEVTENSNSS